jgi:hypothetical protein
MMSCESVMDPVSVLGIGTTLVRTVPTALSVTVRVMSWCVNDALAQPGGAELPPAHPPSEGKYCAKATIVCPSA